MWLPRTLEPEVMDTLAEAVDYDTMDHTAVNQSFSSEFLAALGSLAEFGLRIADSSEGSPCAEQLPARPVSVLDVGCGTARIPIALCEKADRLRITAVDLSAHMLALGQRNVIERGLQGLIRLEQVDAKGLPYADGQFDAVISNSIVHHIPEPRRVLEEMLRVLRPGGLLFVRDLLRPPEADTVGRLVDRHAVGANARQRQLFEQSLHAALTLDEVRALLGALGIPPDSARQTSDRHWTIRAVRRQG